MKTYDVVIVGAGPSGIYASLEFINLGVRNILLIDKGEDIYSRNANKINKSKSFSLTTGFGGSGAFSDGKFNITSEFGGWLSDYLSLGELDELINYVDQINLSFGATNNITNPDTKEVNDIERRGFSYGLKLLKAKVRHLGTEQNMLMLTKMYDYLKKNIEMKFQSMVSDLIIENKVVTGVILEDKTEIRAKYVIINCGREGAKWLNDLMTRHAISTTNNQIDIGVRVETPNMVMEEINKNLYEGKFMMRSSVGTIVRTFCSNPSGHVVIEDYDNIKLVNGHSYSDKALGSKNTNFAILVSHHFEEPFNKPNEYGEVIGAIANKLSLDSVIVQRYGDLLLGRRTTEKRLKEGFVEPTLKEAVPGDLGLVLPYNTLKSIIEMIEVLNNVTPGIASKHTLLYGVETKFYSSRPLIKNDFESKEIVNLYFSGDGGGITRGLAQAAANGICVARRIVKK